MIDRSHRPSPGVVPALVWLMADGLTMGVAYSHGGYWVARVSRNEPGYSLIGPASCERYARPRQAVEAFLQAIGVGIWPTKNN